VNTRNILSLAVSAEAIVIDDSPILHSVDTFTPDGNPETEVLVANWHDDEGLEYEARFTDKALREAQIDGNTIVAVDSTGEKSRIQLFRLEPLDLSAVAA
jgi:hypothetical protein